MSRGSPFWVQLLDMVEFTDYVAKFADPGREIVNIEPYAYSIDGEVLAANITATVSQTFITPMDGDSDFLLIGLNGFGRATGNTILTVNAAIMVQITDLSSARTFFAGPCPLPMIAGQGGFPYLLPGPKIIRARASLQTTAQSAQTQTFTGFYLTFHGARIWYGS